MDKENILQNLKDAGCDRKIIEEFFKLTNAQQKEAALRLMAKHKATLLKALHENRKKIDCLDFLIFSLKGENND